MKALAKTLAKIHHANSELARKVSSQGGFLTNEDISELLKYGIDVMVLVRCNNGRFLCPVQDVLHFAALIEEHCSWQEKVAKASGREEDKRAAMLNTDWVRDFSLPVDGS